MLRELIGKVFGGSPVALVQTLVGQEDVSEAEREEIRRLIERLPRSEGREGGGEA